VGDGYARLLRASGRVFVDDPSESLAARLEQLRSIASLPASLRELSVRERDIQGLAADAATQWTGTHNPRPFGEPDARALYKRAF